MITTSAIEIAIANYFGFLTKIIVPNVNFMVGHECDLLIVYPSGKTIEVEIKRSKSDTKVDLKKFHKHISNKISALYFALPIEIYEDCKEFIPEKAGIITVFSQNGLESVKVVRKPVINKMARNLTNIEMQKVMRLGCLRIWSLKHKLNKKECLVLDNELFSGIADAAVTVI